MPRQQMIATVCMGAEHTPRRAKATAVQAGKLIGGL